MNMHTTIAANPTATTQWDRLVQTWRTHIAAYDAHPYNSASCSAPNYKELGDEAMAILSERDSAFVDLVAFPVSDLATLAEKLDLIQEEYEDFEIPREYLDAVKGDVRRLGRVS